MIKKSNQFKFIKSKAFGLCSVALAGFALAAATGQVASAEEAQQETAVPAEPVNQPQTGATDGSTGLPEDSEPKDAQSANATQTAPQNSVEDEFLKPSNAQPTVGRDLTQTPGVEVTYSNASIKNDKVTNFNRVVDASFDVTVKGEVNEGDYIDFTLKNLEPESMTKGTLTFETTNNAGETVVDTLGELTIQSKKESSGFMQLNGKVDANTSAGSFPESVVRLTFTKTLAATSEATPSFKATIGYKGATEGHSMVNKDTSVTTSISSAGKEIATDTYTIPASPEHGSPKTQIILETGYATIGLDKDQQVVFNQPSIGIISNPNDPVKEGDEFTLNLVKGNTLKFNADAINKNYVQTGAVLDMGLARWNSPGTDANKNGVLLPRTGQLYAQITKVTEDSISLKVVKNDAGVYHTTKQYKLDAAGNVQESPSDAIGQYGKRLENGWKLDADFYANPWDDLNENVADTFLATSTSPQHETVQNSTEVTFYSDAGKVEPKKVTRILVDRVSTDGKAFAEKELVKNTDGTDFFQDGAKFDLSSAIPQRLTEGGVTYVLKEVHYNAEVDAAIKADESRDNDGPLKGTIIANNSNEVELYESADGTKTYSAKKGQNGWELTEVIITTTADGKQILTFGNTMQATEEEYDKLRDESARKFFKVMEVTAVYEVAKVPSQPEDPKNPTPGEDGDTPTPDEPGQPGEPNTPTPDEPGQPGNPGEEGTDEGTPTPVAEETLPETGDSSSLVASLLGAGILASVGLAGKRKEN